MGGCRCSFQFCENATNNSPGKHFFHYPIRDTDRLKKWIEFANNPSFYDLPDDKLRNKVVCEDHFREFCFMNAKKERLIKSAIPTLIVSKTCGIIDLDEEGEYTLIKIKARKDLERDGNGILIKSNDDIDIPTQSIKNSNPIVLNKIQNRKRPIQSTEDHMVVKDDGVNLVVGLKIENNLITEEVEETIETNQEKYILSDLNKVKRGGSNKKKFPTKKQKIVNLEETEEVLEVPTFSNNDFVKYSIDCSNDKNESFEIEKLNSSDDMNISGTVDCDMTKILKIDDLNAINSNIKKITEENSKNFDELKSLINSVKSSQNQILQSTSSISTKLDQNLQKLENNTGNKKSTTKPEPKSKFNLNKIQLFNGIKKYLNPALVALLRMELFATRERKYKTDEKYVLMELLGLGSNIYSYVKDEWRFRLPPSEDVQKWISNPDDDDNNEINEDSEDD